MLQYQYFHTGKEYVIKFSLPKSDETYQYNIKIFETLRQQINGNIFVYAIVNNDFVMLQTTVKNERREGIFVKGLKGDITALNKPTDYIFQFEKSVSDSDRAVDILPEGALPSALAAPRFTVNEKLKFIIPYLFDILVYGDANKPIIIASEDEQLALAALQLISALLPKVFLRRIGFCIGCRSVADGPLTVVNAKGDKEKLSIKIWCPESKNFKYSDFANSYYILDADNNYNNYPQTLSVTARFLQSDKFKLGEESARNNFLNQISAAFQNNGTVDYDELERLSALCYFSAFKNLETIRMIIALSGAKGNQYDYAKIDAANRLLDYYKSSITMQDRQQLCKLYKSNVNVQDAIADLLFRYYINVDNFSMLSQEEKDILTEIIVADDSGQKLKDLYVNFQGASYESLIEIFIMSAKVLQNRLRISGEDIRRNGAFIKPMMLFFSVYRVFRGIPMDATRVGEAYYKSISEDFSKYLKQLLCAILLSSVYLENMDIEGLSNMRIIGFKSYLNGLQLSYLEKLEFIFGVRNHISDMVDGIENSTLDSNFNFIYNCSKGRQWMSEFIAGFTVSELIRADAFVGMQSSSGRAYDSLQSNIRDKLFNLNFIRKYINFNSVEKSEYIDFFDALPYNIKKAHRDIIDFLSELDIESRVNNDFAAYRYGFACDCYKTMRKSDKKRINKNQALDSYDRTPEQQRVEIVEKIIAIFGTIGKIKRKRIKRFSVIGIWAFFFAAVSFLILCIPAVIIPASIGAFDMAHIVERFKSYFVPAFVLIPIVIYSFDILSYGLLEKGNKLLRANKATIICGLIPVSVLVAAYLILYYFSIDLSKIL